MPTGKAPRVPKKKAKAKPEWMEIDFESGGVVVLDGRETQIGPDLAAILKRIAKRKRRPALSLKIVNQTPYDEVEKALALIQKAGLKINMTGEVKAKRKGGK